MRGWAAMLRITGSSSTMLLSCPMGRPSPTTHGSCSRSHSASLRAVSSCGSPIGPLLRG